MPSSPHSKRELHYYRCRMHSLLLPPSKSESNCINSCMYMALSVAICLPLLSCDASCKAEHGDKTLRALIMAYKISNAKHNIAHQNKNFLYIFAAFFLGNDFTADSAAAALASGGVFSISSFTFFAFFLISAIN